jgi:hypothetical protein
MALPLTLATFAAAAFAQQPQREPRIGYIYPAGGRQGTTFQIVVGGQSLRGANAVYASGEGIRASVLKYCPPIGNIDQDERIAIARRMRELIEQRWADLSKDGGVSAEPPWDDLSAMGVVMRKAEKDADDPDAKPVELPDLPQLYNLDKKSLRELIHVTQELRSLGRGQRNPAIAESVIVEVIIDREATPGDRELRLGTPQGLTNPRRFEIGTLPEVRDLETGKGRLDELLPKQPPLKLPALLNGQIGPGDADRFRFTAQHGQRLVIETQARGLVPFLADAVPGWFQATISLYNADGDEIAFVDDYQFRPDPVLLYEIPQDGEYELEIHDSIYRGREDFVYRVSIGEQPFITSIFPLGCRLGRERFVALDGWNLSAKRLVLDSPSNDIPGTRETRYKRGKTVSNPAAYDVSNLPDGEEAEDNDRMDAAQRVHLPRIVDGRIDRPGDVDFFRFKGAAGEEIVAEVIARRVQSPLDSLLRLLDAGGKVLAWNDDHEHKQGYLFTDLGLLTHHADSYLHFWLPKDGDYFIEVSDAQSQGGETYAYRLRIGPPQPGFDLCVTPSSVNLRGGLATTLEVHALREDGFEGEIKLVLKDAPAGVILDGGRVPFATDRVRVTLSASPEIKEPLVVKLEGRATIAGKTVTRPVVPAEEMMQAFLYRHLMPSQTLMLAPIGNRRFGKPFRRKDDAPVRIMPGGSARVRIAAPPSPKVQEAELELSDPPPGITLANVSRSKGEIELELAADEKTAQPGLADNLIVEAFINVERKPQEGRPANQKQRVLLGALPAIPIEIVRQ